MKKIIVSSLFVLQTLFCFSQTEIGNALKFDGINDYIEFDISGGLSEENFTLEFWVKIPENSNNENMDLFSLYNCGQGFNIYLNKNGFPEFVWSTLNIKSTATSIINIKDNGWHHLAFVRSKESNKLTIAIDGSQAGTSSTDFSGYNIPYKSSKLIFGTNLETPHFGSSFSGIIDDLFIWDRALTIEEIKFKSSCTAILTSAIKDSFHFNQGTSLGNNNSIITANGESGSSGSLKEFSLDGNTSNWVVSDLTCVISENTATINYGAVNFDGIDDEIEINFSNDLFEYNKELIYGSKAVTMWVKIPKVGTNNLESNEDVGTIISAGELVKYGVNNEGKVKVYWNRGEVEFSGKSDIRDNQWHHIAFTRNRLDNKFHIYIDGVEEAVYNNAGGNLSGNHLYLKIGREQFNNNGRFHGTIDNIRIWEQYLTKDKIIAYMNVDFTGNRPEEKYMNVSFNLGEKLATEILEPLYTEAENKFILKNFGLFGTISNFVEGRKGNIQINDFDILQDRLDNGETPHDIVKTISNPGDLYGKIYQGDIIFYYDTSQKTISLVKQSHIGKFIWGKRNTGNVEQVADVAEAEKNRIPTNYGIIGSAYEYTRNVIRFNSLKSTTDLSFTDGAPYKAFTHLTIDKNYYLPSLNDFKYIMRSNISGKNVQNSDNFNHYFWTSESASSNLVETYNITAGNRSLLSKEEKAFVLPIRTIDEGSYEVEKPVFKIETNLGTFQNMGVNEWVHLKNGVIEAVYSEKLMDNNKLVLTANQDYHKILDDYSRNTLTFYFSQMKGQLSDNDTNIKEALTITKIERIVLNRFLKEAIEFSTVGTYKLFIENSDNYILKELAYRSIYTLDPSIENYKNYLNKWCIFLQFASESKYT